MYAECRQLIISKFLYNKDKINLLRRAFLWDDS